MFHPPCFTDTTVLTRPMQRQTLGTGSPARVLYSCPCQSITRKVVKIRRWRATAELFARRRASAWHCNSTVLTQEVVDPLIKPPGSPHVGHPHDPLQFQWSTWFSHHTGVVDFV